MHRQSLTTSHRQTDAQPISKAWLPFLKNLPLVVIAEHDVTGHGISLWSAAVTADLSWLCPNSCPPPAYSLRAQWVKRESLDAGQVVLSSNQNIGVLPTLFLSQIQNTAPYWLSARKKVNSIPARSNNSLLCQYCHHVLRLQSCYCRVCEIYTKLFKTASIF